MTASPDDAAASSPPPRAAGGPAASSSLGTTGRRTPEESPMPQRPTMPDDTLPDDQMHEDQMHEDQVHDETVRMRPDGVDGRPSYDGEHDDTRPVTRDWLLGAPAADLPSAPR